MVSNILLANLQERRQLYIALGISLARIEGDDVTKLGAIEKFLLLVNLDVVWQQHGSLYYETTLLSIAILVKLTKVTLEHVVVLILLSLLIFA